MLVKVFVAHAESPPWIKCEWIKSSSTKVVLCGKTVPSGALYLSIFGIETWMFGVYDYCTIRDFKKKKKKIKIYRITGLLETFVTFPGELNFTSKLLETMFNCSVFQNCMYNLHCPSSCVSMRKRSTWTTNGGLRFCVAEDPEHVFAFMGEKKNLIRLPTISSDC